MSAYNKISDTFGKTSFELRNQLSSFGNSKYLSGTKDFLNSNSYVATFTFLILVVVVFVILMRIGTFILGKMFKPDNNPKLVKGMKIAKKPVVIKQDPSIKGSKPVMRSKNQQDGIEFSYSVWLYIDDLEYKKGQYKHIFHKGNDDFSTNGDSNGINAPNNAPGVYLDKHSNNMVIIMNTFSNINERVTVQDIPLNKWINVTLRVEGVNMDVYINGTIVLRHKFNGVPKQNYGDVYVNMNGGYSGLLSDLWYHDYALSTLEILDIVNDGPDMTSGESLDVKPPYFSLRWYLNQ
tara:strand:+ start:2276 stop:3154 length:879 start_codon:yes stop_codon:yes gene_type:complete